MLVFANKAAAQGDASSQFAGQPASYWVEQLGEEDFALRRRAVYALGELGERSAVHLPEVINALGDRHMEVRWYAAAAIGQFGSEAKMAVSALIKSMESKVNDAIVKRAAARSLGQIGPAAKEAVPALEAALTSNDVELHVAAAAALWRIDERPSALQLLGELLGSDNRDAAFAASIELARLGPAAAPVVEELVAGLRNEDDDVRRGAIEALARIGLPAVEPIAKLLDDATLSHPGDAATSLGLIAKTVVAEIIERPETSPRDFAMAAKPIIQKAIPALTSQLSHADESTRQASVRALASTGMLAVPALLNALESPNAATRLGAAAALSRLEIKSQDLAEVSPSLGAVRKRIVTQLGSPLASEFAESQLAAARLISTLAITGDEAPAVVDSLQKLLGSESLATRRWANRAIKQLTEPSTP